MKKNKLAVLVSSGLIGVVLISISSFNSVTKQSTPKVELIPTPKFHFNSFVDCNMAEAWIGDTFRIFPGKYGEDPLWGYAHDLKFADGKDADETFSRRSNE